MDDERESYIVTEGQQKKGLSPAAVDQYDVTYDEIYIDNTD